MLEDIPPGGQFVPGAEDTRRARRVVGQVIELRLMSDRSKSVTLNVAELVKILRFEGVSWSVIGQALGISRQAAQQRFGGAE